MKSRPRITQPTALQAGYAPPCTTLEVCYSSWRHMPAPMPLSSHSSCSFCCCQSTQHFLTRRYSTQILPEVPVKILGGFSSQPSKEGVSAPGWCAFKCKKPNAPHDVLIQVRYFNEQRWKALALKGEVKSAATKNMGSHFEGAGIPYS